MNINTVNSHDVYFSDLSISTHPTLWKNITALIATILADDSHTTAHATEANSADTDSRLATIMAQAAHTNPNATTMSDDELTAWLIPLFATLFTEHQVTLVHASSIDKEEPEYFPIDTVNNTPAMICFAHGFFSSALHEISHWTIAGKHRRTLPDFGYWYEADGRSEGQQQQFEQVEIKPQAIECLLTLACGLNFRVSQDNLLSDFDTSNSTFEYDVYQQALAYLAQPESLPRDARKLLMALYVLCR